MLSAVVLTRNSGQTLDSCLKSLKFTDEVVIVDDYSIDKTLEIAKQYKARTFQKRLNNNFALQRNFGVKKTRGEWALFVDSDETIGRDLKFEIEKEIENKNNQYNGFYIHRKDKFMGRWLKHGETSKTRFLRLARRNSGKWKGKVHEVWKIKGKAKELKSPLAHERNISVSEFMNRISDYARIRAKELYEKGIYEGLWKIFAFPFLKFIKNYFYNLGILDGIPGLVMAYLMSWHSLLVRICLQIYWRNNGKEYVLPQK